MFYPVLLVVVLAFVSLIGCESRLSATELARAIEVCKDHGGLNYTTREWAMPVRSFCNNGVYVTLPKEK